MTVNFVIVSHSATLAEGVVELATQMKGDCRIVAAGGVDDVTNPIGTDALKIMQAIEQVFTPMGVVVMVDLGSAILSAQTALELLESEMANMVRICPAPLVEGTIGAVVSASAGENIDTVLAEANLAYESKLTMINY